MTENSDFTEREEAALRSLAEMFSDKDDRDKLRNIVEEGATIAELILAYRTKAWAIAALKGTATMIVAVAGAYAVVRGVVTFLGK